MTNMLFIISIYFKKIEISNNKKLDFQLNFSSISTWYNSNKSISFQFKLT